MADGLVAKLSRREFLNGGTAAVLCELAFAGIAKSRTKRPTRPLLAYVGTYSSPQGPEGAFGHGRGIYLFEVDPGSGALREREVFPSESNPAWLAFDPSQKYRSE